MRAGRLNRRIRIELKTEKQDDYGQPIETWSEYATVWCSVEPESGDEGVDANHRQAERVTKFRIRYLLGITALMRIVYNNEVYDISLVKNSNERNREMIITAVSHD